MTRLFIGLMSGTSLDGVDAVLADFSTLKPRWLAHAHRPYPEDLRQELLDLHHSGHDELHRAQQLGLRLARIYAAVVDAALQTQGLHASAVTALGVHGQTVRHQPVLHGEVGYTVQLNQPALVAELTGISVVADFRSRDIAAGGQGAPLVPAFHQAIWGDPLREVAALNIGGISNISLMRPHQAVMGFDCGPGNMLMDAWTQHHVGRPYDAQGTWASTGQCHPGLLQSMLAEPYFDLAAPKSTGRDLFHWGWLQRHVQDWPEVTAVDVQATLLELTARTCVEALTRHMTNPSQLIVCGGGALNDALMQRLCELAPCSVVSSAETGLHPCQVEAAAFAWLAQRTLAGLPGNEPRVTGAKGPRVLGAIYPA
jgi:anhydro-N-acetylmuramic acid kinase